MLTAMGILVEINELYKLNNINKKQSTNSMTNLLLH